MLGYKLQRKRSVAGADGATACRDSSQRTHAVRAAPNTAAQRTRTFSVASGQCSQGAARSQVRVAEKALCALRAGLSLQTQILTATFLCIRLVCRCEPQTRRQCCCSRPRGLQVEQGCTAREHRPQRTGSSTLRVLRCRTSLVAGSLSFSSAHKELVLRRAWCAAASLWSTTYTRSWTSSP